MTTSAYPFIAAQHTMPGFATPTAQMPPIQQHAPIAPPGFSTAKIALIGATAAIVGLLAINGAREFFDGTGVSISGQITTTIDGVPVTAESTPEALETPAPGKS